MNGSQNGRDASAWLSYYASAQIGVGDAGVPRVCGDEP